MKDTIGVVVVGCGNMGASHARAYHQMDGFEIAGLVSRNPESRERLSAELGGYPTFSSLSHALQETSARAVSVNTYPDTHAPIVREALLAGCHVFVEKPLALTVDQAQDLVDLAREKDLKLVVGYILRVHPSWARFVKLAQTLGKPLVMRMNLNQQSFGKEWDLHQTFISKMPPLVDCGVHYVDIMCQMTRSNPKIVQGMAARVSDEVEKDNYGMLQVVFEDNSVGWYEVGWGPMMSKSAYCVKDVVGPKGCASIDKDPTIEFMKAGDGTQFYTREELEAHPERPEVMERIDDHCATAYWYMNQPENDLPSIAPVAERIQDLP